MFEVSILNNFKSEFYQQTSLSKWIEVKQNVRKIDYQFSSISVTISNIDFIKKLPWHSGFK